MGAMGGANRRAGLAAPRARRIALGRRGRPAGSGEACPGEGGAVGLFGFGRRLPVLGLPVGEAVSGEGCGYGEAAAAEAAGAGVSGELGPAFQDAPQGEKENREPRGRPYATPPHRAGTGVEPKVRVDEGHLLW